jgi:hypothetical protein
MKRQQVQSSFADGSLLKAIEDECFARSARGIKEKDTPFFFLYVM